MALGAGKMARDYYSVVTSLPALQDIASMTVLCSDKTGMYCIIAYVRHGVCYVLYVWCMVHIVYIHM